MDAAQVKERNPLAPYLESKGITLRGRGAKLQTNRCPLVEHKPGHLCVDVNTDKQTWRCHDCSTTERNVGGSVIDWMMHAEGIEFKEAVERLGGGSEQPSRKEQSKGRVVKIYEYTDEKGALLFGTHRFEPKDFEQCRPNGRGGWIRGIQGIRRVLYNLPKVIESDVVFVCEGEKDADTLNAIGFVATTAPMGAEKWDDTYTEFLRGKSVVLFPDSDDKGRKHRDKVRAALEPAVKSLRIVEIPQGAKDVTEWTEAGATREMIDAAIQAAPDVLAGDPPRSLMDIGAGALDPTKTVLGDRFLCVGGAALFIGPSGVGKSSASMQQDILWSLGREAFGIKPQRALRILTIQAENDDEDLAEMRDGVCSGLQLTYPEIQRVREHVFYESHSQSTGIEFLAYINRRLRSGTFDLLRIDPLQAYAGADLKEAPTIAEFLRAGLGPILQRHNVACIINHHTPKTNNRDTSLWKGSDWMYAGSGSADLTNWARAVLVIDPTHTPHVFKLIAAKRGARVGWKDEVGDRETVRYFCHASDGLYWVDASPDDIAEAEQAAKDAKNGTASKKTPDDLRVLIPKTGSIEKNTLLTNATAAGIGINAARRLLKQLIVTGQAFEHNVARTGTRPEVRIALQSQTLLSSK